MGVAKGSWGWSTTCGGVSSTVACGSGTRCQSNGRPRGWCCSVSWVSNVRFSWPGVKVGSEAGGHYEDIEDVNYKNDGACI